MKRLKELYQLIKPKAVPHILPTVLGDRESESNAQLAFLEKLADFRDDEDAAQQLYGTTSQDGRYRTLKSRVLDRLLHSLLLLDLSKRPTVPKSVKAELECNRSITIVRLLLALGRRTTAETFLNSIIRKARKFHLTFIEVQCLEVMRTCALHNGNRPEFEVHDTELKHALAKYEAELTAIEYHDRILINFSRTTASRPALARLAQEYTAELERILDTYDSYPIRFNYYQCKALTYQVAHEYTKTIAVCDEACQYLKDNKALLSDGRLAMWLAKKLLCYLRLRDYENGLKTAESTLALVKHKRALFLNTSMFYFLLAMHNGKYTKSFELYAALRDDDRLRDGQTQLQDIWTVCEAYLYYVLKSGLEKHPTGPMREFVRRYDTAGFNEKASGFYQDRDGLSIAVLIVQFLFHLMDNNKAGLELVIATCESYSSRYLNKEVNYRSKTFLRLLKLVWDKRFDITEVQNSSKVRRLVANLRASKPVIETAGGKKAGADNQKGNANSKEDSLNDGLEVLPYEFVWERVLEHLSKLPRD